MQRAVIEEGCIVLKISMRKGLVIQKTPEMCPEIVTAYFCHVHLLSDSKEPGFN